GHGRRQGAVAQPRPEAAGQLRRPRPRPDEAGQGVLDVARVGTDGGPGPAGRHRGRGGRREGGRGRQGGADRQGPAAAGGARRPRPGAQAGGGAAGRGPGEEVAGRPRARPVRRREGAGRADRRRREAGGRGGRRNAARQAGREEAVAVSDASPKRPRFGEASLTRKTSHMLNLATKARPYFGAVVLTCALLTAGGVYSAARMPSGVYPEVTFPRIAVVARVPDFDVTKMEVKVTRPL